MSQDDSQIPLDTLHDALVETTESWLEKRRAEERVKEEQFPGLPSYLDEDTLQAIEDITIEEALRLRSILINVFGTALAGQLHVKKIQWWLRSLTTRVAHQAAGAVIIDAARQQDQASRNMLNAALAGIKLGSAS